jgi:hypothetical protein
MMESVPQSPGSGLPQVNEAMTRVLTEHANALARPTGFVQRQVNLTGADFARLLVLGLLSQPDASLDELAQFGQSLQIQISAQGIDQRFSVQAAIFLRALFEVALAQVIVADPVAIPLLERFDAVVLEDSTWCLVPDELATLFRGSGGHNDGEGSLAAFKLHARLDVLRGQLQCSPLLDGRSADARTPLRGKPPFVGQRILNIRDRGYFDLDRLVAEEGQGQFNLTYYKGGVHLLDTDGQQLSWPSLLACQQEAFEQEVLVGETQRLPMRLIVAPIPQEVAAKRLSQQRRQAHKHGREMSAEAELLCHWNLVLTTVPPDLLSLQEAQILLRLRWQIELLWKLWKQHGLLDQWRSHKSLRILCEVYAKLIGLLIQHWVLIVSCWQEPHRSLVKASKAVRSHAILLAYAMTEELPILFVLSKIQQATHAGSRLNSRKKHPNTSQLLIEGFPRPLQASQVLPLQLNSS